MRVLIHAQHLTGVGHAVVAHVLASELATNHDVVLVDGGRPVPRPPSPTEPRRLVLPRLHRDGAGRLVGSRGEDGPTVLAQRAALLADAATAFRPDVVVVEHYPFSKWELAPEIGPMIAAARAARSGVRVVGSVRDISPRTRYEDLDDAAYTERVIGLLAREFDAVVVHSDPRFVAFADFCSLTRPVPVPLVHSGFVAEPVPQAPVPTGAWAVAHTGGIDAPAFLGVAIDAFVAVAATGELASTRLHVFAGLGASPAALASLKDRAGSAPVTVHEFSAEFTGWLHGAVLSVSRCGYNTTTALLRSRVPAVVVPAHTVSDQVHRADRLAAAGLAVSVPGDREGDADALAAAIRKALASGRPDHDLDLDGARATREYLESLGQRIAR